MSIKLICINFRNKNEHRHKVFQIFLTQTLSEFPYFKILIISANTNL